MVSNNDITYIYSVLYLRGKQSTARKAARSRNIAHLKLFILLTDTSALETNSTSLAALALRE
jgi:hypothetical protein